MRVIRFIHVPSVLQSLAGQPEFDFMFFQPHKINVTFVFRLLSNRKLTSEGFLAPIILLPSITVKCVP